MSAHQCEHIGVTFDQVTFEQKTNCDGMSKYWVARQAIGSLFGFEVDGECRGIGTTKEQALQRLNEDKEQLAETMWI